MAWLSAVRLRFSARVVCTGLALMLGLFGTLLTPAHAQGTSCRLDPVVTLSNGVQVTLYEDIFDAASDVTGVTYQLHIPVGLSVKSISYIGPVPASLQTITTYADENFGNFDAYTVVYTGKPNVSVTAYMSAATSSGTTTVSCHTNGHGGQSLHSHLHLSSYT